MGVDTAILVIVEVYLGQQIASFEPNHAYLVENNAQRKKAKPKEVTKSQNHVTRARGRLCESFQSSMQLIILFLVVLVANASELNSCPSYQQVSSYAPTVLLTWIFVCLRRGVLSMIGTIAKSFGSMDQRTRVPFANLFKEG